MTALLRLLLPAAAAALLLGAPRPALADGTEELEGLLDQPVLSTASKAAEKRSAAPATTTTITAEELERFGIRSLDEAINYLSLGMVTQSALRTPDIGARGVLLTGDAGKHVLLLVNGHAMNEPWAGTARLGLGAAIPFELIDHVEIIVGPGSVLYGSNAMLGVINVITRRAKDFHGVRVVLEGGLPTAGRVAAGAGYEFKLFGLPSEATVEVEYFAQKGPSITFAPQRYGTDSVTGLPKRFSPTGPATGIWGGTATRAVYTQVPAAYARVLVGDLELNARAAMYKRGTPYPNDSDLGPMDFDDPSAFERDRWLSLDLRYRRALSPIAALTTRLYGDAYDYLNPSTSSAAEDCPQGQTNGCTTRFTGASRWAGLEVQTQLDWLRDATFTTLLGVDARLSSVSSSTDVSDRLTGQLARSERPYAIDERTLAVYVQQVARPVPWLGLNVGARLDVDALFGSRVSPRAAVVVEPWRGAALKAIYAEAFRAPSAHERFYGDGSQVARAGELRPEIARSGEALFEQQLGTHRLLFGVFRSHWQDLVQLARLSPAATAEEIAAGELPAGTIVASQYQNVVSIDGYGFEAAFEGSQLGGRLRYGANVTGSRARTTGPDAREGLIEVAPQFFANARVSFDLRGKLPTIALAGQLVGSRLADGAADAGFSPTPYAPVQAELRATLSGPAPGVKGLSYRLGADYAFADRAPYIVGAVQDATAAQSAVQLAPVERLRVALKLQYQLPL